MPFFTSPFSRPVICTFFLERDFGMEDYPNTGSLLSVGGSTPSESIKDDFVSRSENKLTTMDRMEPHWAANNPGSTSIIGGSL